MTETDISKVLIEGEYATIMGVKYKRVEEPTPSDFRQKLFDGIKSVFYDPEYERTHWKTKVNMAVDEVLTHFYDILPEREEYIGDYGPSQGYVDGWNHYDDIIKEKLND